MTTSSGLDFSDSVCEPRPRMSAAAANRCKVGVADPGEPG